MNLDPWARCNVMFKVTNYLWQPERLRQGEPEAVNYSERCSKIGCGPPCVKTGASLCAPIRGNTFESLVKRYFHQLTQGCGNVACDNPLCATGSRKPKSPNEAAAEAVLLAKKNSLSLCVNSLNNTHGQNGVLNATSTSAPSEDTPNEQEPMDSSDSVPSLNVGPAYDITAVPLESLSPQSSTTSSSQLATLVSAPSVTSSSVSEANLG